MKFKLVQYFTITSLVAFALVTLALTAFYQRSAVADLIALQESKNVALTKTFANSLWQQFAPFVQGATGKSGDELRASPTNQALRTAVLDLMKGLTVAKVKVFNLDGLTVFSTEASQIGDDKSNNAGYLSAVKGVPASELTHRDTFSAFESVIEDRDVISSYIPIYNSATGNLEGVFEVYDDVTPFLAQINQTRLYLAAGVVLLLALLFVVLLLIVRRADKTIKTQDASRVEAETQLFHAEKMASLGQMVAGVVHEINTPLAYARSNVQMALDSLQDFDKVFENPGGDPSLLPTADDLQQARKSLSYSTHGIDQIRELVGNLKDFSRLDRTKVDRVDLNQALDTVLKMTAHELKSRVDVHRMYGKVPLVECMPAQLNQVFMNLVNNAAQAIDGKGDLWLYTAPEGDMVEVLIQDSGRGMSPETMSKIFDPFYTTKTVGEGTGLGLSISRKIIEQHGGTIEVMSRPGRGTRFTIQLPVKLPASVRDPS